MGLTNENVEPKILAKIKIYVLTRAELLFKVCQLRYAMRYPVLLKMIKIFRNIILVQNKNATQNNTYKRLKNM